MTDLNEAIQFFESQPGMDKLFKLLRDELLTHRRIKGHVKLDGFSLIELESIAHFFQVSIDSLKIKGRVDLEAFNRKLDSPPFNGIDLTQLLEAYFDEKLLTLSTKEERSLYLKRLEKEFSLLKDWLAYLRTHSRDVRWIHDMIEESSHQFEQHVLYLSEGIRLLPSRPIRLSVFSQIITLDADAFQPSSPLGKLWLHVLAETKRLHAIEPIRLPENRKNEDKLLKEFNLFREDISDSVTVANLFAETQTGYHPMWEAAVHSRSVLTVPLREVIKLTAVYPAHETGIVYVVDDPELFTRILDEVPSIPMICTKEEWTCAIWEVFDRIEDSGFNIRFIGNFTPEGIVRAEELLLHYPTQSSTWRMDIPTYLKSRNLNEYLSDKDCELLDKHHLDYLACLKDEMRDRRQAGYLMNVADDLINELKTYYNK
ncbi:TIGR02679 domain-containing protein [Alkalibacterium thalassium]|uniref:TIGR02679 family protein n=1 Tax=Alkalibacterium thalassium TaxID=426701 RepID=A0A1G8WJW3_9LACT|nr:TIGR02679 domain-containing protein [Alkalibacterium thalassium]SDJ78649.1 TIGR02679 family protein [Alkalibacterium thalassium]